MEYSENYIYIIYIILSIIFIYYFNTDQIKIIDTKIINGPNIYINKKVIKIYFDTNNSKLIYNFYKNLKQIINIKFFHIKKNCLIITYKNAELMLKLLDLVIKGDTNTKEINKIKTEYINSTFGPSTKSIVKAAKNVYIPFFRLNDDNLVQLGYGVNQKKIEASCTSNTKSIAELICKDKNLMKTILESHGIPIARGYIVKTKDELIKYFKILNGPVVVKPCNGNHGRGVTINITTMDKLLMAYDIAKKNDDVIIETYIKGNDYRLLVINKKFVAAAHRIPPFIIGNGINSVIELIDILNNDPKRGEGHNSYLTRIIYDNDIETNIKEYGYNKNSIIPLNKKIYLRKIANLSTGASAEDVTKIVNTTIIKYVIDIATIIDLDVCGIDIMCENISLPLEEQKGAVIEVNSGPGLRMHLLPSKGNPINVGKEIIKYMFPNNNGRIPIISVTGTNGKTTTVNLISFILSKKYNVGKTTTNGIYIKNKLIETCDCSGPLSAKKILKNPDVEICVFESARGGILKGLGYDKADVGILTNINNGDHLGDNFDKTTINELIHIKKVVLQNILPNGYVIINASDIHIEKIVRNIYNKIIFFSINKDNKYIKDALIKKNRVIYFDGLNIIYSDGNINEKFLISEIPIIKNYTTFNIENVMCSIAALLAINIDINFIKKGLSEFINNFENNPGRFNIIEFPKRNSKIILDYAHNIDAISMISNEMKKMNANKKIVLYGAAGDRQPNEISEMINILYNTFDILILFVDIKTQRGKTSDELFKMMTKDIPKKNSTKIIILQNGEIEALKNGFNYIKNNDLYLILYDDLNNTIEYINNTINN